MFAHSDEAAGIHNSVATLEYSFGEGGTFLLSVLDEFAVLGAWSGDGDLGGALGGCLPGLGELDDILHVVSFNCH